MARSLVSFVQIKNLFSCYWAPCQGFIYSGHAVNSWPWSICKQSLNRKGTCSSHYILNLGTWVQCSRQFSVTRFHHRKESSFKNPSPAMETEMIKRTALIENGGGEASCDGPVPSDFLLQYHPADWMKQLQLIPKYRVKLIHGVTPIQRWYLPNVPANFEIHIKRDDLTGCELSGNKARKLEFLLADAINQGCTSVITCGSSQSNHCRATAIATRQLGLEPYLLLRSPVSDPNEVVCTANMFLNRLIGTHVYLLPKKSQYSTDIKPRMDQLVQKIKEETGESAYPIPIGGSTAIGLYGYLEGFRELLDQGVADQFTDIAIACGSSGSTAGLALANYLTGSRLKVHGFIVSDDSEFHSKQINDVLREMDVKDSNGKVLQSEDIVHLIDGVKGRGYGLSTQEELDLVGEVCRRTGIIIEPVYTGKSVHHLLRLTKEQPQLFKGNKILFIHSGGLFGLFDGRMDETVKQMGRDGNHIHEWMELSDQAPDLSL
ncbi:uncharacterized protein [Asterias amurensis]|uniref:uncharacterized protein isoform X1 n=2 Tax=Asterias amurensis TaxID=7602 RepID=UPI003AB42AF9